MDLGESHLDNKLGLKPASLFLSQASNSFLSRLVPPLGLWVYLGPRETDVAGNGRESDGIRRGAAG